MNINKRDKINLLISFVLVLLGIILVIYPLVGHLSPNILLYALLLIYGVLKFIEYIKSRLESDREDLLTGVICVLVALSGIVFFDNDSALVLSLTLASWVSLLAIIKLIKMDYYHNRKNIMVYTNLITFLLFLFIGLLTCLNLYFDYTVQTLVLGYFFIINGLLNLLEDAVRISFDYKKKKK